ncbi:PREDICTED: DNA-directed RNA polymerase V subunit 1-like isoform X1 [Lupinus angustifolius]|uniref:DNA-directed RNA polymerase V subunit 1-like isoform X1 n=2 Tax=Lupinus angustifolius TaxID=3871 RepID=UPI00092EBE42|nr:PREDICTED: DNA-directed RNA polymerase V subunit 1-like isoform X1 [Lupinus angustifolius]XP_019449372.1 PREDICTED: DNA-directed RNA polymerase V subunit 1-like isoform X1 [Lupinus angustifolius]XP_019449373.1 PREDICTED: DNA-directed RNA polymerase V subunit 1-like isoform X1 [Lupinus angustifolius]XP_019449374.1 PREDICTED: DNA-directed RNA polymerase V subunit 1-like isoform X1 [Lupinus angustifolius]
MEDNPLSNVLDGEVVGIRFGMATRKEICIASISGSAISHASQLSNSFLGLPLEFGRCDSCGTSEAGKCEGHFGYIELPVPIYHPSHVSELKRMLSLVCLNCLKMNKTKFPASGSGVAQRLLPSCCPDTHAAQVSIREVKTTDGACYLALKVSKSKMQSGVWNFLQKYGYHYGSDHTRTLLPCEAMEIIKRIPLETKKKLAGKGYFPQDGYLLKHLPVPPNCLSVPAVSDGVSVMSSDPSMTILRKLLRKVEIIKSSRSGEPNFESHQIEANDLQSVVDQYLQVRGTSKATRDIETHYGVNKELNESSTKAWLEKMRTLFIRKGSGFSSRSVITGDAYKRINEVGIPVEVAQRITFEERVNIHNLSYLQKLVDEHLCLTYKEGVSTYSLREGSKGHIYLKPGQIVHRRIMDGDTVFINRPPTTHKHSLQALQVYIHDDHTVKINPLICGPLGADFDGDCVHLFYPQSLSSKAEVLELFAVEKQLLSSHSGNLNLQLTSDSLLSLKMLFKTCILDRIAAHRLAMFLTLPLPRPAVLKASSGDAWTAMQVLQCALPSSFDCAGGRYLIRDSEIVEFDFSRDLLPTMINEIAASIFFAKGPQEALKFFDVIQPFLMENIFADGFSVGLQDFSISRARKRIINRSIGKVSPLLYQLRSIYNELVAQQLENHIQDVEKPVINVVLKSSRLGDLIDSKSKSAIDKVVQQMGFLGQQLFERGRFYSKELIEDIASHFHAKCCYDGDGYPSAEYGLLKGCFFHGLDPYEEIVHSISTREILVRSSRGLSEPGTLFKNLMAILRDVVVCYDGTVRNVCSNSVIQFEYGIQAGDTTQHLFPSGEPVGVLAATSMSNPAYKAVLDASPSSTSSWELMKEILLCKANFRNELIDRRVILYFNDCCCGRSYCREHAAYVVKNQLTKVTLKDMAVEFIIEYQQQRARKDTSEIDAGLVGHIHLDETMLKKLKINMDDVVQRCQERLTSFNRKKKVNQIFKRIELDSSESCYCSHPSAPCVKFLWPDGDHSDLDKTANILSDMICPVLLEAVVKGDPRISSASIIWVNPDTNTWVQNPSKSPKGELALDIVLDKASVKQSGDAWRIVHDSCLPILHLIDTRRSIPYAIKQIQELLGISCTFVQAIQRLAASVKMVAKGLLREHLILLASSMTCGGNLVGFNTGGYKALARQLNIQVPFTDATLFTPRKCFERAAEKCHTDSLSSIVASCSWGKHVAVGTGSKFDIVWNAKEIKSSENGGMDVYNFLYMVKGFTNGEEEKNACLGEDIDDLLEEDDMDWGMSPQHMSGFDDAVFEENCELPNGSTSNGWDINTNKTETKSNDWSGWGSNKADDGSKNLQEDSWTSEKRKADVVQEESSRSSAWDGNTTKIVTKSNDWSAWGGNKSETEGGGSDRAQENSWSSGQKKTNVTHDDDPKSGAWDEDTNQTKTKSNDWMAWGGKKPEIQDGGFKRAEEDSWSSGNRKANVVQEDSSKPGAWDGNTDQAKTKSNNQSVWGGKKSVVQDGGGGSAQEESWSSDQRKANVIQDDSSKPGAWDAKTDQAKAKSNEWSSWGEKKSEVQDGGFGRAQEDSGSSRKWNTESNVGSEVIQEEASWSNARDANTDQTKTKSNDWSAWGRSNDEIQDGRSEKAREDSWGSAKWKAESNVGPDVRQKDSSRSNDWETNFNKSSENPAWGSQNESIQATSSQGWDSQIASANSDRDKNFQWGKPKSSQWQACDSQNESNQAASSQGWDSQVASANSDNDKNFQWGKQGRESFKKSRFEGSQGRGSNAGDWRNMNRPPRPPPPVYTPEEQEVRKDIDSIMQSIRRIMQQEGYNDGDPLAAEDQAFVLENVFEHHPDKETKMGGGIDHVMVSRHSNFQESRCMYVVLKDGKKEDFSYRKCLENLVRKKYPDVAESFIGKHFRKPRGRAGGDQAPATPLPSSTEANE